MVAVHAFLALQNRLNEKQKIRCQVSISTASATTLQTAEGVNVKYLCLPALAATNVAELAASAAPVLFVLLLRPIVRRQTEMVKRLTAHLTVNHLENNQRPILNHISINIHAI